MTETKTRIVGIIIKNGKLLMLKGKNHKELWTPGGKIEPGETDEECLKRELREEIGAEVTKMKFFKEYSGKSFYHSNQIMNQRVYIISITGNIKPDSEIESVIWLTNEDLKKKKIPIITITEKEIIPDLIKQKIFK